MQSSDSGSSMHASELHGDEAVKGLQATVAENMEALSLLQLLHLLLAAC